MTQQAPNPGHPAYDPSDPHGFHHDAEGHETGHGHHVTDWKFLTVILAALIFLTVFTVVVAKGEAWILESTPFPITQLWNVIIAMTIATVKAALVCMYFMHLKHDNPLNTFILLFTLLTFALFLAFPAIDTGSRGAAMPIEREVLQVGGTGQGMNRKGVDEDGNTISITGPVVFQSRQEKIERKAAEYAADAGHESITEADLDKGREYVWFYFYDAKAKKAHGKPVKRAVDDEFDLHARWKKTSSYASHGGSGGHADGHAARHGLTPGLFGAARASEASDDHGDHGDHGHDH